MTVSFFGHSDFHFNDIYKSRVLEYLEKSLTGEKLEFFLGAYGGFDNFAFECCKIYKEKHANATITLVTPYLNAEYPKGVAKEEYDGILYPEIESKPKKFAIVYRNRYMVDNSDLIIAYVNRSFGGAFQAISYAKKKGKKIFNLAEIETHF